jgi:proteasome assembly chaperone (PAC2) family protein
MAAHQNIVIIRAKMLSELFCAYMLTKYNVYIATDSITELDKQTLEIIQNKHVLKDLLVLIVLDIKHFN